MNKQSVYCEVETDFLNIVTCGLEAGACASAERSFARQVLVVTQNNRYSGFWWSLWRHIHGNDVLNRLLPRMWQTDLFNQVFPIQSAKDSLRGWLTELTDRCRHRYRESKESSWVQSSAWSQEDRSEDLSARKGSNEYRTQKIESLVHILWSCKDNNCSYNW
jgi:hypothetical protein